MTRALERVHDDASANDAHIADDERTDLTSAGAGASRA
jgi:hypothetical protein